MVSITDEQALERYQAYLEHGSKVAAAKALGTSEKAVRLGVKTAEDRGLHLSDGLRDAMVRARLSGSEVRGGWVHDYDSEGRKLAAIRVSTPAVAVDDLADRFVSAFSDIPAAPPIIRPEHVKEDSVAFFPHGDLHLGSVVSAQRAGRDYNPKIAIEAFKDGFSQCHAAIPPSEVAIILNNGDETHANDDSEVTPRNKHRLKVEGTHEDNLALAVHSTIWQIDTALQRHGRVIYVANPGNHDPNTPAVLRLALAQRYRNEPRVTIEPSQRHMWVWQKGHLFLAADHGEGLKPEKQALHIPARFPVEFGASRFWYFFTSHFHNQAQDTFGGIIHKRLPAICRVDTHADDMGFTDTSAMTAMQFDIYRGLRNELTVKL